MKILNIFGDFYIESNITGRRFHLASCELAPCEKAKPYNVKTLYNYVDVSAVVISSSK